MGGGRAMSAFDFEERKSSVISSYDIFCKQNGEKLEELIKRYKEASQEQIATAGANALVEIFNDFTTIWNEDQETMLLALFAFVEYAINIGCTGMKDVPEKKKNTIGKFFISFGEETAKSLVNGERFFHPEAFTEDEYREVIEVFLSASMKPFQSPYPFKLYQFIIACAVADTVNEPGLDKLRKLRKDYLAHVRKRELAGKVD